MLKVLFQNKFMAKLHKSGGELHKKPQNIISEHLYKVRKKLVFDGGYFVWILI